MTGHKGPVEPAAPWRGTYPLPLIDEQRLLAANADAADYYRHQLLSPAGARPQGYLHERRLELVLNEDSIWKVGYAPPGWTGLTDHLRDLGYADRTLVEAGLAHTCRRGTLIDRFRDRIVVPIHGHAGGIVAFVARAAPAAPAGCPRYLNTPTTALYRKADTVLGLHEQRHLLAAAATPISSKDHSTSSPSTLASQAATVNSPRSVSAAPPSPRLTPPPSRQPPSPASGSSSPWMATQPAGKPPGGPLRR